MTRQELDDLYRLAHEACDLHMRLTQTYNDAPGYPDDKTRSKDAISRLATRALARYMRRVRNVFRAICV